MRQKIWWSLWCKSKYTVKCSYLSNLTPGFESSESALQRWLAHKQLEKLQRKLLIWLNLKVMLNNFSPHLQFNVLSQSLSEAEKPVKCFSPRLPVIEHSIHMSQSCFSASICTIGILPWIWTPPHLCLSSLWLNNDPSIRDGLQKEVWLWTHLGALFLFITVAHECNRGAAQTP